MSVHQSDISTHSMEQAFIPPQPGGLYVTHDGREPIELLFRLSPDVRELLNKAFSRIEAGLQQEDMTSPKASGLPSYGFVPLALRFEQEECHLNTFDINSCLERLSMAFATAERHHVATAIKGVCEIFDHVAAQLEQFPAHPRLFRFGELFPSKGIMKLVLDAAEQCPTLVGDGGALQRKLEFSYKWDGDFAPESTVDDSQGEDAGKFGSTDQAGTAHGTVGNEGQKRDGNYWQAPAISLSDVRQAFNSVASVALQGEGAPAAMESILFLCHAVQDVVAKLGMMTGDGYEKVPGTRLFTNFEKAISRVMIEHALLTSSPDELLESAKVGALMVAIGGSVLTKDNLIDLGFKKDNSELIGVLPDSLTPSVDGNSYGMMLDHQVKSGLRILRLVRQLSNSDVALQGVLEAYNRQEFSVPGAFSGLADSCAKVWQLKALLSLPTWAPRPESFHELQNQLVQIISNGRAEISQDGREITWASAPSASSVTVDKGSDLV